MIRRAHARRLLLTLAAICRQLGRRLRDPARQAAHRAVERSLRRLAGEEGA